MRLRANAPLWIAAALCAAAVWSTCAVVGPEAPGGWSAGWLLAGDRGDGARLLAEPVRVSRPWRLVFVAKDAVPPEGDGSFWGRSWRAMRAYGERRGVEVRLVPVVCQTCVDDQVAKLDALLAEGGVDGVILGAVDSVHLGPVVERVVAAGVPVLAYDTPVASEATLTLVTPDNHATGRAIGEWVAARLNGQGRVALLDGSWSHQNALERRAGIIEGLGAGVDLVVSQPARWKRHLAAEEVRRWLGGDIQLDVIIAANDAMALGALDALEGSDMRPLVTGMDGDLDAMAAVREGRLALTVDRAAEVEGEVAVEVLLRHLELGERFPSQVVVSEVRLVTPASARLSP